MKKRIGQAIAALLVLTVLVYGFWPQPTAVQTARVERRTLQVIVEEEGETRVDARYTVSAPVAAYLRRIDLKVGDRVECGQAVAQLEAPRPVMLDSRSRAETEARVVAAQASLERVETAATLALEEQARMRRLHESAAVTMQALDRANAAAKQAVAARQAAAAELAAVGAMLDENEDLDAERPVQEVLRAPISGQVLAVHQQSAGAVSPGTPLLELGDLDRLEVVVDVLSRDAVRIHPGTRVILDRWGGDVRLDAVVHRIAPAGYTAVSALGIEERRVSVEARITSPRDHWESLGAGYQVLARFVIWEQEDILQAPTAALFRTDDGWAAFIERDGRAVLTPVDIGRQAGLRTQILSGLEEGDAVLIHPPQEVTDGSRIDPGRK